MVVDGLFVLWGELVNVVVEVMGKLIFEPDLGPLFLGGFFREFC